VRDRFPLAKYRSRILLLKIPLEPIKRSYIAASLHRIGSVNERDGEPGLVTAVGFFTRLISAGDLLDSHPF
jgi:hypothetical protein